TMLALCQWGAVRSNTRSLPRELSALDAGVVMRLQDVEAALREIVRGLEPEALAVERAAGLVDTFATIEKLAGAGKALAARRVADSNLWRGAGERSAAHWLARRGGISIGSALATLETPRACGSCRGWTRRCGRGSRRGGGRRGWPRPRRPAP